MPAPIPEPWLVPNPIPSHWLGAASNLTEPFSTCSSIPPCLFHSPDKIYCHYLELSAILHSQVHMMPTLEPNSPFVYWDLDCSLSSFIGVNLWKKEFVAK